MRLPMRLLSFVSLAVLLAAALAAKANPQVQQLWQLLDYIAVDYAAAVQDGEVVSELEYGEMQEFSATVSERLAGLPAEPALPDLQARAQALQQAIADRADPSEVDRQARALADALLEAYPVPRGPAEVPDLARADTLYHQYCASCHGPTGAGDGPAGAGLEPAPIAFTDLERARQRSVFGLQQVIENGLEGTSMASYAQLPEADRWALAFHIGQMAFPDSDTGKALWERRADVRAALPDLDALVQALPASIAGLHGAEADALTAYLRRHPEAVAEAAPESGGLLDLARLRLREGAAAYAAGEHALAREKILSAYLDGFEPVEPMLRARDTGLMAEVETAMARLRADIGSRAPVGEVQARVDEVAGLLDRSELVLTDDQSAGAGAAFVGALTILLREGIEALLLVIAMVAFLRKANRTDAMPYVHAGWIGALLAGFATWFAATSLVAISGAGREVTEGIAALVAVVVLVSVGIWMHGKGQADAWQRYIREKLSHALSKGSSWFLFGLAFLIVYREAFETVLFYAALWSQGNHAAVLAGAAVAAVVLAIIAGVMLRVSMRLPFGTFFKASAVLIAVLAVVLAGKGVAALQEAGWVSMTLVPVPRFDLLGIHPTLETLLAQLVVLVVLVAGFAWNARTARAAAVAG